MFGKFWDAAQKVCANPVTASSLREHVHATAKTRDAKERVGELRHRLVRNKISAWEMFVLLQAHCGASEHLGKWLLGKGVESSPEFQACKDALGYSDLNSPDKTDRMLACLFEE